MAKTLEAHDELVRDLFGGGYRFEIPDYQRPYSWTTEQTEELFDDLLVAMRDSAGAEAAPYFMGSIVLIKHDKEVEAQVVDGQQRLTTLTILFAALREKLPEAADDITSFLHHEGKKALGEASGYRLLVRHEDLEFFESSIQRRGGIATLAASDERLHDSRLRIRENARLLLERLETLEVEERLGLLRFLSTSCSLVVVSTPDQESAYRIFSVLNDRGLDLAPIDIIKAEILGAVGPTVDDADRRAVAEAWSRMEKMLGRGSFGELFAHIRSMHVKQKQRSTLVRELREHVISHTDPIVLVNEVIVPHAETWNLMRNAAFEFESAGKTTEVNDLLTHLNHVGSSAWVPPALLYLTRFRDRAVDQVSFLALLERLTYFLMVTKANKSRRIKLFADLTSEIEKPESAGDARALETLALDAKRRGEFRDALNGDIYSRLPRGREALLLRLESLQGDGSKRQNFNRVSIEHVLPQNPSAGSRWLEWFPDEELRASWTHRLANLVPLHPGKNSSAGNTELTRKKAIYFGTDKVTPFLLIQSLQTVEEWTPVVLEERQRRLLGILVTHWGLDEVSDGTARNDRQAEARRAA